MVNFKKLRDIQRTITKYIPIRIQAGYGVTTDNTLSVSERDVNNSGDFYSRINKRYIANRFSGSYLIDSQIRGKGGELLYVLIHAQTGKKFTLSKSLFEILFEAEQRNL